MTMEWRKSSYSTAAENCVEAREHSGGADVRDTQNRDAGHLGFGSQEWIALLSTVSPVK